jgi:hypothetical protein
MSTTEFKHYSEPPKDSPSDSPNISGESPVEAANLKNLPTLTKIALVNVVSAGNTPAGQED